MQVFISYRTIDSRFARLLGTWLQHNGISIWFAEFDISIETQFEMDRIHREILAGVDAATHAILITNAEYCEAPWCDFEAKEIERRFRTEDLKVLEICLPQSDHTHQRHQYLGHPDVGRVMQEKSDVPDFRGIADVMTQRNWIAANGIRLTSEYEAAEGAVSHFECWGERVEMPGWRQADEAPELMIRGDRGNLSTKTFRREAPFPIHLSVAVGQYERTDDQRPSFSRQTDREIREWAINRANGVVCGNSCHLVYCAYPKREDTVTYGVHLERFCNHAHLGLSGELRQLHPRFGSVVFRVAFITLFDVHNQMETEVVVVMYVYGGRKRLAAVTPVFEQLLISLERQIGSRFESVKRIANTGPEPGLENTLFDGFVESDSQNFGYRLRQIVHWFTGRWYW